MAFNTEVSDKDQILISGPATITIHSDSPNKRVKLRIDAAKDVIIVREKIPV